VDNRRVGTGHYENFPIASVLCPPSLRQPVRAIYAFARTADDIADEGDAPAHARLDLLAQYRAALHATARSDAAVGPHVAAHASWPAVFRELGQAMRTHTLPLAPLESLLDAFEQDVRNPAYESREQLLDYCRRSANPVGRLMLHLYGIADAESLRQSDAICTALQLINFWQDLSVDVARGRMYVPLADARRHGVELVGAAPAGDDSRTCALVRELVHWTASVLAQGAALPRRIPGRAGWELRMVVHGGWRILERIARMDYGSWTLRPRLSKWDVPVIAWRSLWLSQRQFAPARLR
jgi:hydroxysqualene synthase